MNDKDKSKRKTFRTVFTVLAVVCTVGGIALLAGLTEDGSGDTFGGIALLVVAVVLAVIGWIPWKIKEKQPKQAKEPKPPKPPKEHKFLKWWLFIDDRKLDKENVKTVQILGTRTGVESRLLATYNFTIYSCLIVYKDGRQEVVEVQGGTDFFKQIEPFIDKTDNLTVDEMAMYDTIDDE